MNRIAVRELRNDTSAVVRRAQAGERIIVTVDGIPMAEIGPIGGRAVALSMDDLIATGMLAPRATDAPAEPARPVRIAGRTTTEILSEHRRR